MLSLMAVTLRSEAFEISQPLKTTLMFYWLRPLAADLKCFQCIKRSDRSVVSRQKIFSLKFPFLDFFRREPLKQPFDAPSGKCSNLRSGFMETLFGYFASLTVSMDKYDFSDYSYDLINFFKRSNSSIFFFLRPSAGLLTPRTINFFSWFSFRSLYILSSFDSFIF